jgi:hypothetical protein
MRYCGKEFSSEQIRWITNLIENKAGITRQELSKRFCESFNWRKPDGGLKDMSCRVAFIKMDKDGLIKLPAPKRAYAKPGSRTGKSRRTDPKPGVTKAAGEFALRLELVSRGTSALWNEYVQRYHYLGYKALPGAQLRYFVKTGNQSLALLGFGAAAWKTAPRDDFIGWDAGQREQNLFLVVNNARFLILPWVKSKNLASRVLSMAARQIADDWQARYKYRPVLLETFVEKKRFAGTCYKAANWICVGDTQGRGKLDVHMECKVPVKSIWLYPLSRDFRKQLAA